LKICSSISVSDLILNFVIVNYIHIIFIIFKVILTLIINRNLCVDCWRDEYVVFSMLLVFRDQVSVLQNARGSVRLKSVDSGRAVPQSLLLWNVAERSETSETDSSEASYLTYVQYISFRLSGSASLSGTTGNEPSVCMWSHPVRLRISPAGKRHTLAVPVVSDDGLSARACCLAVQSDSTLVYLTLADDMFPFIELQNNCDIPLFYGQAATDTAGLAGTVM